MPSANFSTRYELSHGNHKLFSSADVRRACLSSGDPYIACRLPCPSQALGKQAKIGIFCLLSPNLTGIKEPNPASAKTHS